MTKTLPLLSVLLLTIPLLAAAAEAPDPILDTAGKKLRADAAYYVVPVQGKNGGLYLINTAENYIKCPLDLAQVGYQDEGIPLQFTPVNPKKGVVRVSTDLNVEFYDAYTPCSDSNVWRLNDYDVATGQFFVTTGGVKGNPGWRTVRNWFKVEKFGYGYKLVYCPSVCSNCKVMCRDVGVYVENGNRRLALSRAPLEVKFKKF